MLRLINLFTPRRKSSVVLLLFPHLCCFSPVEYNCLCSAQASVTYYLPASGGCMVMYNICAVESTVTQNESVAMKCNLYSTGCYKLYSTIYTSVQNALMQSCWTWITLGYLDIPVIRTFILSIRSGGAKIRTWVRYETGPKVLQL